MVNANNNGSIWLVTAVVPGQLHFGGDALYHGEASTRFNQRNWMPSTIFY
jgi:hypothetical protein